MILHIGNCTWSIDLYRRHDMKATQCSWLSICSRAVYPTGKGCSMTGASKVSQQQILPTDRYYDPPLICLQTFQSRFDDQFLLPILWVLFSIRVWRIHLDLNSRVLNLEELQRRAIHASSHTSYLLLTLAECFTIISMIKTPCARLTTVPLSRCKEGGYMDLLGRVYASNWTNLTPLQAAQQEPNSEFLPIHKFMQSWRSKILESL